MSLPSISQWIDTIANPHGRFRSLGEFEAERDAYGNVRFMAGNNAAVFPVRMEGRRVMLKCYIKEDPGRSEVYRFISGAGDCLLPSARFLPKEAFVYDELGFGEFRDILVTEWIEGDTLETEIKRAGNEFGASGFRELADIFDRFASQLLAREWAHGDLKPENIIITNERHALPIDYDAMFVPEPGIRPTTEIGTPSYQHPLRDESHYGSFLDDYPVALICVSLHALALEPRLYAEYHRSDNITMTPDEIIAGDSAAYDSILDLFAQRGEYGLYELALQLKSPSPEIPGLQCVLARTRGTVTAMATDEPPGLFGSHGLWGYRTADHETIIGPIFEEACEFSEGLAVTRLRGEFHVIDYSGQKVIDGSAFDAIKPFGCGLAACRRDGKWGYIDTRGDIVIPLQFDRAGTMHENLAPVSVSGRMGYVDTTGQMAIVPSYDNALGFRDGQAEVVLDGSMFRIDRSGRSV